MRQFTGLAPPPVQVHGIGSPTIRISQAEIPEARQGTFTWGHGFRVHTTCCSEVGGGTCREGAASEERDGPQSSKATESIGGWTFLLAVCAHWRVELVSIMPH